MAEDNVAVLIDYENVGLDSIQYLLDQLSDVGRIIVKRAYGDWSVERGKRDQLLELGIEAKHLFRSTKSGKNSSDILLAIDAIDLLHVAPVDTFVIVSSDSDFVPLVSKLRASGKSVFGAGRREASSATLVKSCDRYIYLDEGRVAPARRKRPGSSEGQAASLIVRAVEAAMDDQGQAVGSKLHQTMTRIDPSFDYRALGHRTFGHFLDSQPDIRVTRLGDGGEFRVQLDHSGQPAAVGLSPELERQIDVAWRQRGGSSLSGRAAASDAAKVLATSSLKAAGFASLDKLLAASEFLRSSWSRDGNVLVRR